MKKLVVLMALLVMAGMLWAQAAPAPAAPTFTMGMRTDYMWANDFSNGWFSDRPILELRFNWKADDFTTAYVELEEGPLSSQGDTTSATISGTFTDSNTDTVTVTLPNVSANGGAQGGFRNVYTTKATLGYDVKIGGLDRAYFTTDVGKALKLPVPVVVMYGLNEWNNKDGIKVTKSEFEDWLGEADIRNWGAQVEVTPSPMVTIRSNWAWNPGATNANTDAGGQFLIGAYGTVAPITYELTYDTHGFTPDLGWLEGGLKFVQDMTPDINLAVAVSAQYDMADAAAYGLGDDSGSLTAYNWSPTADWFKDSFMMYQVGVQVMYQKMFAVGLAYRGGAEFLGALQPQLYFTPKAGDPLELFAQVGLGLDSDAFDSMFDSAEVALRYTIGKVQWYFGYLYGADLNRGIAREWSDFDVAGMVVGKLGAEVNAIFMRGNIAF